MRRDDIENIPHRSDQSTIGQPFEAFEGVLVSEGYFGTAGGIWRSNEHRVRVGRNKHLATRTPHRLAEPWAPEPDYIPAGREVIDTYFVAVETLDDAGQPPTVGADGKLEE